MQIQVWMGLGLGLWDRLRMKLFLSQAHALITLFQAHCIDYYILLPDGMSCFDSPWQPFLTKTK